MWIDLFINGKEARSWLIAYIDEAGFGEKAHEERRLFWEKKIEQCKLEAADEIIDCKFYWFILRVRSVLCCRELPDDLPIKPSRYTDEQILFIQKKAAKMTVAELACATGMDKDWIYDYFRRRKIQYKRAIYKPSQKQLL